MTRAAKREVKAAIGVLICAVGIGAAAATFAPALGRAEQAAQGTADQREEARLEIVAPGRVEPVSGEIKIAAPVMAAVADVLAKPGDKVFAGELLVRLKDDEARARVKSAEAQVALHKRVRDDVAASGRAAQRRKAEDAVADAERALVEARSALDHATSVRSGGKPDGAVEAARGALVRAQNRLNQQQSELRRIEAQSNTPLPTAAEGQLNVARAELWAAHATLEKFMIRAPIAGKVLKVNVKPGELAAPSSEQPLILLGDTSALRVRAQVDEQDLEQIRTGQPVLVRSADFPDGRFAGKVSFIAPIVELGDINLRGERSSSVVQVVEVVIDLTNPGQLAPGMKVDAYFGNASAK